MEDPGETLFHSCSTDTGHHPRILKGLTEQEARPDPSGVNQSTARRRSLATSVFGEGLPCLAAMRPESDRACYMCPTCDYAHHMKMLQIRNVPDELHRKLKARAALEGQSMSDYAQAELRRALERPTRQELVERVRARQRATVTTPAAEAVRAERDSR